MKRILQGASIVSVFFLVAPLAPAQPDYPNRPVRIVHGFTAGGISDVLARSIGAKLGKLVRLAGARVD